MTKYEIKVPIIQEFVGEYDFHDTSTSVSYMFDYHCTYNGVLCEMQYNETVKEIVLKNIDASDEINAFIIGNKLLSQLAKILSLFLQKKHSEDDNTLHGHVRIKWFRKDMEISPRGLIQSDVKADYSGDIELKDLELNLDKLVSSSDADFLLSALYGSLQTSDHKAKYYHAFTIIEFIESQFRGIVGTPIYKKDDTKEMAKLVADYLINNEYPNELATKAKGILSNTFASATQENRASKLVTILKEKYNINAIKYAGRVHPIDEDLAQDLINKRNKLFHAGGTDNIKHQMDQLILICEKVVWHYLNN